VLQRLCSQRAMAFREVEPEDADLPAEPASMVAEPPAGPAGTGEFILMLYKKRCIAAVRKRGGNQVLQAGPRHSAAR